MEKFFTTVIPGMVTGAIYSMMAAGIVLTYQTSGIFNFAHSAVAFTTAFFYYEINSGQDVPIIPAAILSVFVFAPLAGLILDRILLRRLATAPVYARLVGTIGLLVALPKLAIWLVEAVLDGALNVDVVRLTDRQIPGNHPPGIVPLNANFRADVYHPFGSLGLPKVTVNAEQLSVFVTAAVAAVVLWYVVRRMRIGLEMRAMVDRDSLASLRGVDRGRTSAFAWILTMVLAGIGGILIAPLFHALNDDLFTLVVLGSLAAVAFSGVGRGFTPQGVSILWAFVGGLALGVVQNIIAEYGDSFLPGFLSGLNGFKAAIPYILTLVILLLVRDVGREAGTAADEAPARDHREGLPAWRRRLPWTVGALALMAYSFHWVDIGSFKAGTYQQSLVAQGLVLAIVFLSFVVVTGLGGMVSMAQATFVTAGGFMAGWALNRDWGIDLPLVANHGQLNFVFAAVMGTLVAAAAGALIAIPIRRLGTVALALGTLAVAFVADIVVFGQEAIGKGSFGWFYRSPSLDIPGLDNLIDFVVPGSSGKLDLSQYSHQILLLLVLFGALTLLIHSLHRSATGRAMLAVRSSEVAAGTSGVNPAKYQVAVFALSAAIAGFGGAMLGMVNTAITVKNAPPLIGLIWLAVAVTFGVRRPGGALLAGLAFACTTEIFKSLSGALGGTFEDLTTVPYFTSILFGLGAINLAKDPDGLLALVGHQRRQRRLTRERKAHVAAAESEFQVTEPEAARVGLPTEADLGSAALALDRVVAGYGEVEVLHDVSVAVRPGEILALLGANGAGKSTLCAVAAGLLPLTRGRVLLAGHDVTRDSAHTRARARVLLVPEARGVFPGLTVEDNLRVLLRSSEAREAAYARFPILGERRRQAAGLLSGGEQQMLSLAPALADPPAVFIADEPTLGLAPLAAEIVVEAIRELRERGCAILLVEEKAREIMELANTVAFMELGTVVWMGAREDADVDRLAEAYLGVSSRAGAADAPS